MMGCQQGSQALTWGFSATHTPAEFSKPQLGDGYSRLFSAQAVLHFFSFEEGAEDLGVSSKKQNPFC